MVVARRRAPITSRVEEVPAVLVWATILSGAAERPRERDTAENSSDVLKVSGRFISLDASTECREFSMRKSKGFLV